MNESPDEPPLSSKLHSWASNHNPFRSGTRRPDPESSNNDILPRHVDNRATSLDKAAGHNDTSHLPDTKQEDPSALDKKGSGEELTTLENKPAKVPVTTRFFNDVKYIMFCSWINVLLIFVPVGIILGAMVKANEDNPIVSPSAVFAINAVAIIPLASLLSFATESVASKLGDTIGALLNVTFGNAVELIIFIIALVANEIRIVQAALLGSILSNLLLILGMCFVFGGLRFREQLYNATASQMSACLLSLSVVSLLLPTAFHASFSDMAVADHVVLKVSRGTSVILLLVYIIYLLFQLKSHAYMYESTPQHLIDEESHPGILADMLDSSSSDDASSSSDSDSDSSANSDSKTNRLKRALRRHRRKSHSSSKDSASTPSFKRTPSSTTNSTRIHEIPQSESPGQMSPMPSQNMASMFRGNESAVDDELEQPHDGHSNGVASRDFEGEQPNSRHSKRKRKKMKKHLKRKQKSKYNRDDKDNIQEIHAAPLVIGSPSARPATVGFAQDTQEIPTSNPPSRPFNLRNISSVRPALSKGLGSTVFTHHEATGRSLPYPAHRLSPVPAPMARANTTGGSGLRRTASLPEILDRETSNPRSGPASTQPLPHLMPSNQTEAGSKNVVQENRHLSQTSAVILLLISTGLVAICAEFLVDSINYLVKSSGVSQVFIGLIVLPIVGNAAEHVTAVTVASKNKMDLAINVALGSSIQIALFVTPLVVILGWIINRDMSLYFSLFETVSLFASAFIVNYLMIDGRSNYLEGALLIAAYVIIALAAFFYPACGTLSTAAGGPSTTSGSC